MLIISYSTEIIIFFNTNQVFYLKPIIFCLHYYISKAFYIRFFYKFVFLLYEIFRYFLVVFRKIVSFLHRKRKRLTKITKLSRIVLLAKIAVSDGLRK